jgi:hypothetical protein
MNLPSCILGGIAFPTLISFTNRDEVAFGDSLRSAIESGE